MAKKFAYCIGGCRGPTPFLADLVTDRSDCYAAFFKEPGPPGTWFLPNSTTNTGRNAMYAEAAKGDYEYIIMLDDDLEFIRMSHADGFRKFESLIDEFHPALAIPKYAWHLRGENKYSQFDPKKRVQGLGATDAILNAIHRDVWNLFLPYWCGGDSDSWWNAQQIVHRICAFLLPGGFVQFNDMEVRNLLASDYPRHGKCVAADAYMQSMIRPDWLPYYEKFQSPGTFHALFPLLRDSYKLTRSDVGRYFDVNHEYWAGRF